MTDSGPLRGRTCTSRCRPRARRHAALEDALRDGDPRRADSPRARACLRPARSPATSASRAGRSSRRTRSSAPRAISSRGTGRARGSPTSRRRTPSRRGAGAGSARPARFTFSPGVPDLTAFPRAAWSSALRQGLRDAPAATLGYGDPRGRRRPARAARRRISRGRAACVADPELVIVCAGFRHGLSLVARVLRAAAATRWRWRTRACRSTARPPRRAAWRSSTLPVDERGARTDLLAQGSACAAVLSPGASVPARASSCTRERRAAAIAWARCERRSASSRTTTTASSATTASPWAPCRRSRPHTSSTAAPPARRSRPGLRLGWLVVPPRLIDAISSLRAAEDVHVPAPDQIALCHLLRSGAYERHVRRMRARYRARRDRLVAMLAERAPALVPVGISAGLGVLLELPDGGPTCRRAHRRGATAARSPCSRWRRTIAPGARRATAS